MGMGKRDVVTSVEFYDIHDEKVRGTRMEGVTAMGIGHEYFRVQLGFKSQEDAEQWLLEHGAERITERLLHRER